ncbi:MAG: hypothetical protein U0736_08390 [Gemmataceae bacterium]
MADTSGRPTGITAPPLPADLPPPAGERAESYRPLSLLAILGFVLGAAYAGLVVIGGVTGFALRYPRLLGLLAGGAALGGLVVALASRRRGTELLTHVAAAVLGVLTVIGLGSLVAYASGNPWLWPSSLWPVMLAGMGLSWLASSRIRASEGTLSGVGLARWGFWLSLTFGLIYGAYLLSNNLAVIGQASGCADEFLALIRKGDVPQAFLRTLPPRSRPAPGADLRRILEVEHNVPRGPTEGAGAYAMFTRANYVELIRMGGDAVTWTQTSVDAPEFDRGSYRVGLNYDVVTPFGRFALHVATLGQEAADEGGGVRRKWNVEQMQCSMSSFSEITPERKRYDLAKRYAADLAQAWLTLLRTGNTEFAYLLTLPHDQRGPQSACAALDAPALMGLTGVATAGGLGINDELRQAYRTGRQQFGAGTLLDVSGFWADDTQREEMLKDVRTLLAGGRHRVQEASNLPVDVPYYREVGGQMRLFIPVRIGTGDGPKRLHYMEADVEVAGPATGRLSAEIFKIVKLHLTRGQTAMDPRSGQRPGMP